MILRHYVIFFLFYYEILNNTKIHPITLIYCVIIINLFMFLTAFCYKLLLNLLLIYNTFSGKQQRRPSFFPFLKVTIQVRLLSFQNMRNQFLMFTSIRDPFLSCPVKLTD